LNGLREYLSRFGARRLAFMAAGVAVAFALLLVAVIHLRTPDYAVLRSNVEPAQLQAITEKISQAGITYKLTPDGTGILAPQEKIGELNMALAEVGVGGGIGNELLDKQSMLGSTSLQQTNNLKRALEGELAETIRSIDSVRSVRVHLVMPEHELFAQDKREPSASITLTTVGRLPAEKVNAIRYLVSASVPDLQPGRISIVDQSGTLLARADTGNGTGNGTGNDLVGSLGERQAQLEMQLRQKIMTMLEQVVGAGRVDAKVSVDLEADQIRSDAELYNPDLQVIARSTTVERNDNNNASEPGGNVSVSTSLPEESADLASTMSNTSTSAETSEQIDYANSKTRTTTVRESGGLKRITAAVVVDGKYIAGADGRQTYVQRSPAELEQIALLVKSAVGFNADRNDEINVTNMRFALPATGAPDAVSALPFNMTGSDVARLAQTAIIATLGLLALVFVARPFLRTAGFTPALAGPGTASAAQLGGPDHRLALPAPMDAEMIQLLERAAQGDEDALILLQSKRDLAEGKTNLEAEINIAQIQGRVKAAAMRRVGDVVERHPGEAAAVIRKWMQS
jgi:flagellar M-ring protein FliF